MKTSPIPFLLLCASIGHGQAPLTADEALRLAAQNRPSMRAARLKVERARASQRALGAYAPTTVGIGASSRSEVGATDQDLFLTQPIDAFGRQAASKRAGSALMQIARAEYVGAAIDLQIDVLTAYANAVAAQQRLEMASELMQIADGLFAATKRRFEEGKVAEMQLVRASIELERARQAKDLSNADAASSLALLAGLVGQKPEELKLATDTLIQPIERATLDDRPDLQLLRAQAMEVDAQVGIVRASSRPEVNIQLVRSPWSTEPGYFVGRAQLTWALFDHGRARAEENAARRGGEANRALFEDAKLRAESELRAAQIEVDARRLRIKSYEGLLISARDLLQKSQRAYTEGVGTHVDVLEANRALREVEGELVEARHQFSLASIAQQKASGFLSEVLK